MGYYTGPAKDYTPSMDASRFQSGGPSPVTNGSFKEAPGTFTETPGTISTPKGMFMPDGSQQQQDAIKNATKLGMPSALIPGTPPVKSPLAPLDMGQPFRNRRGAWFGGDVSLSPYLQGSFLDRLRSGGFGLSSSFSDDEQGGGFGI